jgi:DNA mismatch repair protein MutS
MRSFYSLFPKKSNVLVKEGVADIVFLHKIAPGSADRSYGIHVARLAGMPRSVLERAEEVLGQLEGRLPNEAGQPIILGTERKDFKLQAG